MKRKILVLTLVAAFLSAAVSVGMAAEETQTVNVLASSGAGIDSFNGAVHIQIPPNARPYNFKLRYAPNPGSAFSVRPANAILLPNAFNLEFLDGEEKLSNLTVPGTAVVRYNPLDLGGRSEATLKMMHLPEDGVAWSEVPSTVDTATDTVTARFTLPGSYAVAASNVMPTAVPAPTQAPAPPAAPTPVPGPTPLPAPAAPPAFRLGFATLASLIPDVVGQPLENEHHGANGDSLQQTSTGLMAWRKADNWTAFTNGSRTWVNGPFGVMERSNAERFDWEAR